VKSFRGKILVIRGGAIGDFILTLPAIAALRQQFAEAHLEVLGYPHIIQLALAGGLVDRIQSIEARALAGFFALGGSLAPDLVDYFSEFDLIVSYLYDPDGVFQTNLRRCTTGQLICGPHRPEETGGVPAAQAFLRPLERLAIFDADPVPRLTVRPSGVASVPVLAQRPQSEPATPSGPGPTLALHPGSGSDRKNWPEARWAELIQQLLGSSQLRLLLVGGEAEGERLQRLVAALPLRRVRVAQSLPLVDLARWLQGCRAFVGHDSGISHLAAALGLPGLVLWGDTAEAVWRPPSEHVVVLRHPRGLSQLGVSQVLGQLQTLCPTPMF
jgi:ADP-heptose:LPS heptosyltransferase